jgi:hypothetical protein
VRGLLGLAPVLARAAACPPAGAAAVTPAEARLWLRARAAAELAEERPAPPTWAPFPGLHRGREVLAADAARRSRAEHALRLAAADDDVLAGMLAEGWHPFPAAAADADHVRYVNLRRSDLRGRSPASRFGTAPEAPA